MADIDFDPDADADLPTDGVDIIPFPLGSEAAELDAMYRQALAAFDSVDVVAESLIEEPAEPTAGVAPAERERIVSVPGRDRADVTAEQVIEAALFVGGGPLTTHKLCDLLRSECRPEAVDDMIESLNRRYVEERRPYGIRLGEGGWRMELTGEFESVRRKVFGMGPREVKLSQDALEALSLVAYRQPMSKDELEQAGKRNAGALLRQLLRRELVALERDESDRNVVRFRTTARFLQLFGLSEVDELPRAEELELR